MDFVGYDVVERIETAIGVCGDDAKCSDAVVQGCGNEWSEWNSKWIVPVWVRMLM